jgi:hypothetical protein
LLFYFHLFGSFRASLAHIGPAKLAAANKAYFYHKFVEGASLAY